MESQCHHAAQYRRDDCGENDMIPLSLLVGNPSTLGTRHELRKLFGSNMFKTQLTGCSYTSFSSPVTSFGDWPRSPLYGLMMIFSSGWGTPQYCFPFNQIKAVAHIWRRGSHIYPHTHTHTHTTRNRHLWPWPVWQTQAKLSKTPLCSGSGGWMLSKEIKDMHLGSHLFDLIFHV